MVAYLPTWDIPAGFCHKVILVKMGETCSWGQYWSLSGTETDEVYSSQVQSQMRKILKKLPAEAEHTS